MLAGCALAALSAPAFAEATAPADAAAVSVPEIVVTAQNRKQNVNDVPIAINVISGDALKKSGFSDLNDIDKIAPVVQINQDQGTVKISVRGVGTTSNDESQDTSVVINIDGEYLNRPNIMGMSLFDMERVEVLRGPQGTLYGRNSTGGAINFITRKPGRTFGVDASASYGNYNAVRADGGIDVPFGDKAGIRVSGFFEDRDGYVKSPAGGGYFVFPAFKAFSSDDNHAYGGRASLRLDPTDALSINLAAEYSKRSFTPGAYASTDLNAPGNGPTGPGCNASGFAQVAPAYAPLTLCVPSGTNFLSKIDRSNFAAPFFGKSHIGEDSYAVRGRIAYKFGPEATLSYIGGYRHFNGDPGNHLSLPETYQNFSFVDKADTQSHELRLNGVISGVTYQVGGFYFKEKLNRENGFFVAPIGIQAPLPNGSYLTYFGRYISSESKSLFGQVEVPLGSNLTAVGGLRYTDNKRSALYLNGTPFGAGPPDAFLTAPGTPTSDFLFNSGPGRKNILKLPYLQSLPLASSESKVTWLAGLNYKPSRDTLIYAKASTGFKGGGFDAIGAYRPETNTAFEGGWKQTFGDHRQHQFNLGAFYYNYKDLQVSVLLDTTKGGQTFNAGKATIWGIEASGNFALDDNTHFDASVNYLNARYDELLAQFNVFQAPGGNFDLNGVGDLDPTKPGIQQPNFAGNRPPFSPKMIITMGLDHVIHLGNSATLTARAETTFKSAYFLDFYNYRDGTQEAFTQSNLSLEYAPDNKRFSIAAYVKNLENTRPLTYGSFTSAGADDIYNWQFGSPRLYGVRVGIKY
ncbi:TonB-dependent receptor [Novosphingobium sp.]|uniref:TonB-dependent receptor n=1 Tax=Novosphingobium sp. TaxID=1874826 RepID=UPI00333F865F